MNQVTYVIEHWEVVGKWVIYATAPTHEWCVGMYDAKAQAEADLKRITEDE